MAGENLRNLVPLDELTEEETPITYGVVKPGEEGDVLFVRGGDIAGGRVLQDQLRTIGREVSLQYRRTLLRGGEILVSLVGNPGQVAIAPPELAGANIARQVGLVRLKSNVDTRFIKYFLQSREGQTALGAQSLGSVQQVINLRDLKMVKVYLPPLPEQKAIARILGTLDDRIELNRRMNVTLEAMARALFQSWFVDFDPVRAKLDGRKPAGLDPATAELFPAHFQESPLGHISQGWTVVTVADTCESIFSGGAPSTQMAGYWGGNIPWLSSGETRNRFIIETEKTITEAGAVNSSTRLARPGSTVIAGAGQGHTRGQTSLLTFESYINQSVVVLSANPSVSSDLFLFFDLARRYEEFRQLSDSHSSRGSLTTKLLAGIKLVLPPRKLIQKFDEAAKPAVNQITANLHQSRTLSILRDALLPKLLSGELRVKVGERYIVEASA